MLRPVRTLLTLASALAAAAVVRADAGTDAGASFGASVFPNATITGVVLDARSGRPLGSAAVTLEPDLGPLQTNAEGLWFADVGRTYGRVGVRVARAGFSQVRAVCVWARPGANALADVALLRDSDAQQPYPCSPACGEGDTCRGGVCVSACSPLCPCHQRCSAGVCVDDASVPAPGQCGPHSAPAGGTLCQCDPGTVPSASGAGCVDPVAGAVCPAGAETTVLGCACPQGTLPAEDGSACRSPDEVVSLGRFVSGTLVATWTAPVARPRALAFDGVALWTVDLDAGALVRFEATAGAAPRVLEQVPLGTLPGRVQDLAATEADVHAVILPEPLSAADPATLLRLARATGAITLSPLTESQGFAALATDGQRLLLSHGVYGLGVRDLDGGIAAPARFMGNAAPITPTPFIADPIPSWPPSAFKAHRFSALSRLQYLAYRGTAYDGTRFLAQLDVFNALNRAQATPLGSFRLPIAASHVIGFEVFGARAWVLSAGPGASAPTVEEFSLVTR